MSRNENVDVRSAHTRSLEAKEVAAQIAGQFDPVTPAAVLFFASHKHDGRGISAALRARYPEAEIIGCTTAGEFNDQHHGELGVSAVALGRGLVTACAGAIARFDEGVRAGVSAAAASMERRLGFALREAPESVIGFTLVEGLKMKEEALNDALGDLAPLMSFVGGSAGDNLEFKQTRVFYNGEESDDGAALLVLRTSRPFSITKTCSFESTGKTFKVTRADVENRVIYELDGQPVLDVYARAVDVPPQKIDTVFMRHPVGLLIDGKPWIRSPQRVLPDGGLKFYCQVLEGMEIHVMKPTDIVGDTTRALGEARSALGGAISGAVIFNCILRRLEIDGKPIETPFYAQLRGIPNAGFHTYGESYLGHINQTLTAVVFG